jgi:NADH-quinone oxidoreductase subunit C
LSARTAERVSAALSGIAFQATQARDGMACVEVERGALRAVLERLKRMGFEANTLVTAVDHFPAEPRFEVVHQFLSFEHNERVRVRTRVTAADASVPSCCVLWPGASFSERECWDLFGIRFEGHPDLRRLLMPEGYDHHPLRKDFPHQGIEPDRLYREWDRRRRMQGSAP